ncbi:hypothetical protein [Kaistia defluvii]|uniref:Tail protein n=1 Tax=Kaistia defluvii TaxID=410841 RepID=A0ABV2R4C3_9HYPH
MAFVIKDRARMTTATTGTGAVTLGAAVANAAKGYYRTFAAAGVANGDTFNYAIEDGTAWEIGLGTYTASGTVMARSLLASSTGGLLNLTGAAEVYITALGDYLVGASGAQYRALATAKIIGTDGLAAAMVPVPLSIVSGSVAWDMTAGIDFTLPVNANFTLPDPTAFVVGRRCRIRLAIAGAFTMALGPTLKTPGGFGLVLSQASGAVDYLDLDCVSTSEIRAVLSKDWK